LFERRLRTILFVLLAAVVVLVARLIDLQIIHADEYREQAAAALLLQRQTLPFVRGRICDRSGVILASDEPSWEIRIDYGLLAMDEQYLAARASRFRRNDRYGQHLSDREVESALRDDIDRMWRQLAWFAGESQAELRGRAAEIRDRVTEIRRRHAERHGFDERVREETWAHPVVSSLDDQQQIAARRIFREWPWVKVEAANRRVYPGGECLAHVLGRIAPVDARAVEEDPHAGDPLRRYLPDETLGVAGVEHCAEELLRGHRGRYRRDRNGRVIEDTPPEPGRDVHLTIRLDLQQRLYDLLGNELPRLPHSPGGSIVVLDVPTREVLALVSWPAYDPNRFREIYSELRRDSIHMPLRFRAVSNRYPPGSIIKPLTCLAGLSSGVIDLHTRFECTGYLFPDNPGVAASKCWAIAGTGRRMAHGSVDVVDALEGSCNIFMYHVGMLLGVDTLCTYFDMAGIGKATGIGLREAAVGVNPTPSWLNDVKGRAVHRADARLFAIGQGEVSVTPAQAANLMATYAAGTFKPLVLVRESEPTPTWELPVRPSQWRAVHEGLYRVVNAPTGTAHKYACFRHDRWVLCGKTGTADTHRRPVSFRIAYTDRGGHEIFTVLPAGSRAEAVSEFRRLHPEVDLDPQAVALHRRYPEPLPGEQTYSHAWFAGYLQRVDASGRPLHAIVPRVAFAVLVEYGGSGGRTSGPVARQVAHLLLETLGPDLDPDARPPGEAS